MSPGGDANPLYLILADGVLLGHAAFVAFAVGGGLMALRWPRLAWLQIPAAIWGALVELNGWLCPLTPLESRLRVLGGGVVPERDFVGRFLLPIIYPEGVTPTIQAMLGLLLLGFNVLVYAAVIRSRRRRR